MNKIDFNVNLKYRDSTRKYINNATPNSHKLKFDNYFMDNNGNKHPIKEKEIAHPIPREGPEYERALWIKKTFGGKIHLVPRITTIIDNESSVTTPDFRWNGNKWDLKTPSTKGKFDNSIERFVKKNKAKEQSRKYIIDFKYIDKTDEEIIKLAEKTLRNPYREWIEELMLVRGNKLIKIYSKNK